MLNNCKNIPSAAPGSRCFVAEPASIPPDIYSHNRAHTKLCTAFYQTGSDVAPLFDPITKVPQVTAKGLHVVHRIKGLRL
ncbi:hypothetical protein CC2G_007884 [Coprinopsis cinerea AmutBmut pab1-1]|nr:hypothetical protein CC2G_007884 [Coprinopsis cinerea AmutBmut pab1-1]